MASNERDQERTTPGRTPRDVPVEGPRVTREPGEAVENALLGRRLYEELWNARDFDGMLRHASADIECLEVATNTARQGHEGYRAFAEGWATAFPDARVEIRRVIANDNGVVVEFVGHGTHTGPLVGPAGTIPPTGRRAELSLCDVLEIEEGQVRRVRSYYDMATLMRQLGLMG